jgi:hypothetical protein
MQTFFTGAYDPSRAAGDPRPATHAAVTASSITPTDLAFAVSCLFRHTTACQMNLK